MFSDDNALNLSLIFTSALRFFVFLLEFRLDMV